MEPPSEAIADWESELEMQKLLDLIVIPDGDEMDVSSETSIDAAAPTALGLEMCGGSQWNLASDATKSSATIGVF